MSNKGISELKTIIHNKIEQMNDETILQMVEESITSYGTTPSNDILEDLSAEQQNRLQQSIRQADAGQTIPHEEVIKMSKEWLSK